MEQQPPKIKIVVATGPKVVNIVSSTLWNPAFANTQPGVQVDDIHDVREFVLPLSAQRALAWARSFFNCQPVILLEILRTVEISTRARLNLTYAGCNLLQNMMWAIIRDGCFEEIKLPRDIEGEAADHHREWVGSTILEVVLGKVTNMCISFRA